MSKSMATLSPERWREINTHLAHLLSLPEEKRGLSLDSLRGENPDLADLLGRLLTDHDALAREHFLEYSPIPRADDLTLAGTTIGAYRLISPIGQGGMGSVWLAEPTAPIKRPVALKLIR